MVDGEAPAVKLVASMIVGPGEQERYLPVVLKALSFCDDVILGAGADFFEHEGRARQRLLEATLKANPTHVLAIDADEVITDGAAVRLACEGAGNAWSVEIAEVWEACDDALCVRMDGGWVPHTITPLWRVIPGLDYRIRDRPLACGRVPEIVEQMPGVPTHATLLHFGWANRGERQARYDRYVTHDGGRFHQSAHLQSIMFPDDQVECQARPWPELLEPHRAELVARANR